LCDVRDDVTADDDAMQQAGWVVGTTSYAATNAPERTQGAQKVTYPSLWKQAASLNGARQKARTLLWLLWGAFS